jgi:hypothetical protein
MRTSRRQAIALATLVALFTLTTRALAAQGVTTAAISGTISDEGGAPIEDAQIAVLNRSTGVITNVVSRPDGRYDARGIEVGGPYTVSARRVGFRPEMREGLSLSLGENLRLDMVLRPQPLVLDTTQIIAESDPQLARSHTGIQTTVSDTILERLPTFNRDLSDFLSLTPQLRGALGPMIGGTSFRFNNYQIDGSSETDLYYAMPAASRSISLEAVKEYQVLISPYDVRQGNFAGALVNAVTKSGTNELHGSAFYYSRTDKLARDTDFVRDSPYDQSLYGFSLGGPIVRDRVHFFVAPEFQRHTEPTPGPYLNGNASNASSLPADTGDITRFIRTLNTYGLTSGSAARVTTQDPIANLFARIDVSLPAQQSRLVLRDNYSHEDIENDGFGRDQGFFPLSSAATHTPVTTNSAVLQLYTNFARGIYNELIAGYASTNISFSPIVREPLIDVFVPNSQGTQNITDLEAGSITDQQGNVIDQHTMEITDNLVFPAGSHVITIGTHNELQTIRRTTLQSQYGEWQFSSLDSLQSGLAAGYRISKDLGGADATLRGAQFGIYAQDNWELTPRLVLTYGLRLDVPVLRNHPAYSALVDSIYGRRTDAVPSGQPQWSPRVGFNWDVSGDRHNQLRGGVGLFLGRPPMGRIHQAFANFGEGIDFLTCGPEEVGPAPAFNPDFRKAPQACGNGVGFDTGIVGPVSLLNANLRSPQTLRASLGYDRRLPWSMVATLELLYTRNVHDYFYRNLNLAGPVGTDAHGRVMYGTIDENGFSSPALISDRFSEVVDLENNSRNYSYGVTAQVQKRFSDRLALSASYDYSRIYDVQLHLATPAGINQTSQPIENTKPTVSGADQPHRVLVIATYTMPWHRLPTDLSVQYDGESNTPYTYREIGDVNADGSPFNDYIYIPKSAADTNEIRFDGPPDSVTAQQRAFDAFIDAADCLKRQRGHRQARSSCRGPWINTMNLSIRQSLSSLHGHTIGLNLDIFNVFNLLNKRWGQVPDRNLFPLKLVGYTQGSPSTSQGVFRFPTDFTPLDSRNFASVYQMQLSARISF